MFILDSSGSVYEFNFYRYLVNFVARIASQLPLGSAQYQVGVVSFGNQATYDIRLDATYNASMFSQFALALGYKNQNTNTSGKKEYIDPMLRCKNKHTIM